MQTIPVARNLDHEQSLCLFILSSGIGLTCLRWGPSKTFDSPWQSKQNVDGMTSDLFWQNSCSVLILYSVRSMGCLQIIRIWRGDICIQIPLRFEYTIGIWIYYLDLNIPLRSEYIIAIWIYHWDLNIPVRSEYTIWIFIIIGILIYHCDLNMPLGYTVNSGLHSRRH